MTDSAYILELKSDHSAMEQAVKKLSLIGNILPVTLANFIERVGGIAKLIDQGISLEKLPVVTIFSCPTDVLQRFLDMFDDDDLTPVSICTGVTSKEHAQRIALASAVRSFNERIAKSGGIPGAVLDCSAQRNPPRPPAKSGVASCRERFADAPAPMPFGRFPAPDPEAIIPLHRDDDGRLSVTEIEHAQAFGDEFKVSQEDMALLRTKTFKVRPPPLVTPPPMQAPAPES